MSSFNERRMAPGTFGYVVCPDCAARFVIAGPKADSQARCTAVVACPECRIAHPVSLPTEVGLPFRILTPRDPMRRED